MLKIVCFDYLSSDPHMCSIYLPIIYLGACSGQKTNPFQELVDFRLKSGSAVVLGGICIYNKTPLICIHNKNHGYLSLNKVNYFLNCQDKNVYNHLDWKKCWLKVLILFYCRKVERIGMFCFKYKCDTCQYIVGKTELLFSNVLFLPQKLKGWGCV